MQANAESGLPPRRQEGCDLLAVEGDALKEGVHGVQRPGCDHLRQPLAGDRADELGPPILVLDGNRVQPQKGAAHIDAGGGPGQSRGLKHPQFAFQIQSVTRLHLGRCHPFGRQHAQVSRAHLGQGLQAGGPGLPNGGADAAASA